MNNQNNNNNGSSRDSAICIVMGIIVTILLFIMHATCSEYDMNSISFFICLFPAFIGFVASLGC